MERALPPIVCVHLCIIRRCGSGDSPPTIYVCVFICVWCGSGESPPTKFCVCLFVYYMYGVVVEIALPCFYHFYVFILLTYGVVVESPPTNCTYV